MITAAISTPVQQERRTNWAAFAPYLWILPSCLIVALLTVFPLLFALHTSLHRRLYTSPNDTPFIGAKNYADVLQSFYFKEALLATLFFSVLIVIGVVLYGLLVSLFLSKPGRMSALLCIALLLPWAVPTVMAGVMWKWLFNGSYGAINSLLQQMGLISSNISWFGEPSLAMATLVTAHIWKWGPQAAIMCLATIRVIPKELYEAARVDGAGSWATFWNVVWPFLRPTVLLVLVLETVSGLFTFELVYVMTGGGPANSTALLAWFAHAEIFQFLNLGRGTALAFIIMIVTTLLIVAYAKVIRTGEAAYS
jgi:ABC-type sugar transport system permease subunit